ncbi:hypothetical protein BD779DRAFT_1476986 [Infundibulicybe gibba]|nr:hypothetical protein BD779DRAFT_1476986 [Infundibulicybe gibba]
MDIDKWIIDKWTWDMIFVGSALGWGDMAAVNITDRVSKKRCKSMEQNRTIVFCRVKRAGPSRLTVAEQLEALEKVWNETVRLCFAGVKKAWSSGLDVKAQLETLANTRRQRTNGNIAA